MTPPVRRSVTRIARNVRRWVERFSSTNFDLCGFCAIASVELFRRLRRRGVPAQLVVGDGHVFVEVDGVVVDVTATQFQGPKILIQPYPVAIPHSDPSGLEELHGLVKDPWIPQRTCTSVADLIRYLREEQWPSDQIPRTRTA